MARISAWDERTRDSRGAAVAFAVVAAHVALIIVTLRGTGHREEVVDITLFALPIIPDDRPREPSQPRKPLLRRASDITARRAAVAGESAPQQVQPPSLVDTLQVENNRAGEPAAANVGAANAPAPQVDWHAEIGKSVREVEQRERIESGRRSLGGPNLQASSAIPMSSACPFERCEPGWGTNSGVFESQHSKAGRIETVPNSSPITSNGRLDIRGTETVQWINNWCYSILSSADPLRQGAIKCAAPLGKTPARGDLFDHMHEGQPAKSHDTESPWLSYGLSFGASR